MSKTARCWRAIIALSVLAVVGCGDKSESPKVVGAPPNSLAGIWAVTDTSTACYPFAFRFAEDVFTDTICVGGPDFGIDNAQEAWEMFLHYAQILPGRWTDPEWISCSGEITDTSVQVYCVGTASATLEECNFKIRIYTNGTLTGDHWTLLRKIERIEGPNDCGHRRDDSTVYCTRYVTDLNRVGDAPVDCASSDNVVGPVRLSE